MEYKNKCKFVIATVTNRNLFVLLWLAAGTSSDSSGPIAQVSVERGRRRKWEEVLFRPPQRKGRAPSRTHREAQGTSTGSSTQKTIASAGFFSSSERIPAVVSKLSTGEEFQRHGDESSTSFTTHERVIFYTTELFLYFRTLTIAKKKNDYLLLMFEHYYEIKQKLFNNLYYLITRFFLNHLRNKKRIKRKKCDF